MGADTTHEWLQLSGDFLCVCIFDGGVGCLQPTQCCDLDSSFIQGARRHQTGLTD